MPRPPALDPLFRSLRSIKGVGPQLGALLNRFFAPGEGQDAIALDLLMHMPVGIIDRRRMDGVAGTFVGHTATLKLHIDRHEPPPRSKPPGRIACSPTTRPATSSWCFSGPRAAGSKKLLPVGEERYVSGEIGFFQGEKQITHPDYIVEVDKFATLPLVEPVYPLTQGLSSKALTKLIREVLDTLARNCPNGSPPTRLAQFKWPGFDAAMTAVHVPEQPSDGELWGPARMRLAYDEYLAGQLALLIVRSTMVSARGIPRTFTGEITARVEASLPFALTAGPAAGDRRYPRGSRGARPHVAAAAGRCRRRQDRRRADGDGGDRRERRAIGADVADRTARGPAFPHAEAAGRSRRAQRRHCSPASRRRPNAAPSSKRIAGGATNIVVGTHALFQSGGGVRQSRASWSSTSSTASASTSGWR